MSFKFEFVYYPSHTHTAAALSPFMNPLVVDCEFLARERSACAYILKSSSVNREPEYCIIETNSNHAVPLLLARMEEEGIGRHEIRYVIITHVHLDHAGGAGRLLAALPRATLLCHPKAERHMIDPSNLIKSARRVWGDAKFDRLYGEILAIPAGRIKTCADGEEIAWGADGDKLKFIHTRGHANHHMCIYDSNTRGVFTGDAFGAYYPDLQNFPPGAARSMHIHPITTPTEFDSREAKLSIAKILALQPERLYLTHFGALSGKQISIAARHLLEELDYCDVLVERLAQQEMGQTELLAQCTKELEAHFADMLLGNDTPKDLAWEILRGEVELNAQGLVHAAMAAAARTRRSKI